MNKDSILLEPLRVTDSILIHCPDGTIELSSYGNMLAFISIARIAEPDKDVRIVRIESKPFDADKLTAQVWRSAVDSFRTALELESNKGKSKIQVELGI